MLPPLAAVCCGEIDHAVRVGQLSPATTSPLTTTEPSPPSGVKVPQLTVTLTAVAWPTTTSNGALVPMQVVPTLVVAFIVTRSPVPDGTPTLTEALALMLEVLIVPCARIALAADSTLQSTELRVTLPCTVNATRMVPLPSMASSGRSRHPAVANVHATAAKRITALCQVTVRMFMSASPRVRSKTRATPSARVNAANDRDGRARPPNAGVRNPKCASEFPTGSSRGGTKPGGCRTPAGGCLRS